MDGDDLLRVILLAIAVVLSGFFSGSEAAFLSIQRGRLAYLLRTKVKRAEQVAELNNHPERFLPTVLTGNNLVNTAAAALGTAIALSFFDTTNAIIVATVVVTGILLIFSELVPKTLAAHHPEKFALLAVVPIRAAEFVLKPLVWLLEKLSSFVARLFGVKGPAMAEEEIRALIHEGREVGSVEPSEAQMLERVFRFGDRQIREMMTPRTEIVALEKGTNLVEFLNTYRQHSHTRFPVYEGTVDNILGTLSTKEVLRAMANSQVNSEDDVTPLLWPAYFVPETKLVGELFQQLRGAGYQMVMVADEFGGLAGLVTLKQMVEEVVGRVGEEGVGADEEYEAIDENTYRVEGGMHIEEANEQLGFGIPDGDYETIAGFLLSNLGRIPDEGDRLHYNGHLFEVEEMRSLKIEQVKVIKVASPTSGGPR